MVKRTTAAALALSLLILCGSGTTPNNSYSYMTGTSMAAPMVSAAMAYDVSRLSGAEWTVLLVDNGTAPEIKTQTVVEDGRTYLTVQIIDSDGDLRTAAYASGTWTVEQFHGGRLGQMFSLNSDGTARLSVGRSGTYTFYAVDSVGNETVETVSVTVETWPPTQPGGESRFWRSVKWFF